MTTRASGASAGSSLSKFYFVFWLALGAAGIFYVTIAALAPETLRTASATPLSGSSEKLAAVAEDLGSIKTEIEDVANKQQAMASSIETLRGEVSGVKGRVTELSALSQTTLQRVAGLEGKPSVATNTPSKQPATQQIAVKPQPAQKVPPVAGEVIEDGVAGLSIGDDEPEGPVIKPKKPAQKVAVAEPANQVKDPAASKPYAVNLAVSTSPEALRQIWQLFKDQHGTLLDGITPRAQTVGTDVRLLAGQFPNQAAAAKFCAKLIKEGMSCAPTPFGGKPL